MISFLLKEHEGIKKFFEGDDSAIPVSEFMYLHTRPLLRPNFLTEINELVEKVGQKIIAINLNGKPIDDMRDIAIKLGTQMDGEMDEEKAKAVLFALRQLYKLCKGLDEKL